MLERGANEHCACGAGYAVADWNSWSPGFPNATERGHVPGRERRLFESAGPGTGGVRPIVRFAARGFWNGVILKLSRKGWEPSREFGYFISSTRAKTTSAITNRQSTAIIIATRVQDDLSPNALTSFALARPAGRSQRPADRRSDLPDRSFATASHSRKRSAIIL